MTQSRPWLKIALIIITLSACSKPPRLFPSEKPTDTYVIPSPRSTSTSTPTSIASSTYTPTGKPCGTRIASTTIDQGDSVFIPVDILLRFEASLTGLSQDLFVIDITTDTENRIETFQYLSAYESNRGNLLSLGDFINPDRIFFDGNETWIFGGFPTTNIRYVLYPSKQSVYKFSVCTQGWDEPSPLGQWVGSICTEPGLKQEGLVVVELISLADGRKYQLEIPSHEDIRYANNFIHWVSEDSFIGLLGYEEEPCLVLVPDLGMRCAPELLGKPILTISPLGTYLLTNRSRGYSWIKDIHLIECFQDRMKCDPIATLDDKYTSSDMMYWSPDETMLAVDFGDHLTSTTAEIGYYDTEKWTYHQVGVFPRSSGFFEWCPDSSCMIIVGDPSYILYLDGTREEIPHDLNHPIAVIEVP